MPIASRRRSQSRGPAFLAGGLLLAAALGGLVALDPFGWRGPASTAEAIEEAVVDVPLAPVVVEHADAGAATPEAAVGDFLDAVIAGDDVAAHTLLDLEGRRQFATPEAWAKQRVNLLGELTAWRWIDRPTTTRLTRTPSISLVSGVHSADAEVTWSVVDEDGWRVDLASSILEPILPSDDAALNAAQRWLDHCTGGPDRDADRDTGGDPAGPNPSTGEDGVFLGSDSSALDRACGGTITPGASAQPVAGRVAADLMVAFGPTAPELIRAVPIGDPVEVLIVLAPDVDDWIVVDVVEPS